MTDLSKNILGVRKKLKLTQKEFAKKIGISFRAYQDYERGVLEPRASTIEKIADLGNVSLSWLFKHKTKTPLQSKAEVSNIEKARRRIYQQVGFSEQLVILRNLGLSKLPREIMLLKNLYCIDLSENHITSLSPDLDDCSGLTTLLMSYNQLTSFPIGIENHKGIVHLNLVRNQISELPKTIGQFEKLSFLDLTGNQLKQLPKEIGNLKSLKCLYLDDNQLHELPKEIGLLENLEHLSIADNFIEELPIEITNLQKLVQFNTNGNPIEDLPKEVGDFIDKIHLDFYLGDFNIPNEGAQNSSLVDDEEELLDGYRHLSPTDRAQIKGFLKGLKSSQDNEETKERRKAAVSRSSKKREKTRS